MAKFHFLIVAFAGGFSSSGFGTRLFPPLVGIGGRNHDNGLLRESSSSSMDNSRRRTGGFLQVADSRALAVNGVVQHRGGLHKFHGPSVVTADDQQASFEEAMVEKLRLNTTAMRRGLEELEISSRARAAAQGYQKNAVAWQQVTMTNIAIEKAKKTWATVKPKPFEAKAQLLEVRRQAARARMYANHAEKVAFAVRNLVSEAADKATEAMRAWIKQDAEDTAKATAADIAANFAASKVDKIAAAVAAAAEPCHLAMLRTQKFCAETYTKAKSTQDSMRTLMAKARGIAQQAQVLQVSGNGFDAQTTMTYAAQVMNEAEQMRQYGVILYNQANSACSSAGQYTFCEQQAAANAAANQIINAPMKFPPA